MTEKNEKHIFDMADLIAYLSSLKAPNRAIDQIIETMLAGSKARLKISTISVIGNKWLYSATPHYTRDPKAVEILAARRGVKIQSEKLYNGFKVNAFNDIRKISVASNMETVAGIMAIAALSSNGASHV